MRRLWHQLTGHTGTWIEEQHGVMHHVCARGWAEPAARITCRVTRRLSLDELHANEKRAAAAVRLAARLEHERRLAAARRAHPPVVAHVLTPEFGEERRSGR